MTHLLAKLSNPIVVQILKYIGKEKETTFYFCPFLNAIIDLCCVCKTWNARFDHQDLNLWKIVAIEFGVDLKSISTINYRKLLLTCKNSSSHIFT
mmetsp:Transcript_8199/g.11287  ORF Transcript_8199/g.11287 Transcript_8199/m.11287 type:complete len:95 (+) Transcript_8199:3-287(+)